MADNFVQNNAERSVHTIFGVGIPLRWTCIDLAGLYTHHILDILNLAHLIHLIWCGASLWGTPLMPWQLCCPSLREIGPLGCLVVLGHHLSLHLAWRLLHCPMSWLQWESQKKNSLEKSSPPIRQATHPGPKQDLLTWALHKPYIGLTWTFHKPWINSTEVGWKFHSTLSYENSSLQNFLSRGNSARQPSGNWPTGLVGGLRAPPFPPPG